MEVKNIGVNLDEDKNQKIGINKKINNDILDTFNHNSGVEKKEVSGIISEYRKVWKDKIQIDPLVKEKILSAVKNIPLTVKQDDNGNVFIDMEIWDYFCEFEDINLEKESDERHIGKWWDMWDEWPWLWYKVDFHSIPKKDLTTWVNNIKLAEYVYNQMKEKWLSIPDEETQKTILDELWKIADLDEDSEKIAMWMYLTWINWEYWLSNDSGWWKVLSCGWLERARYIRSGMPNWKLYLLKLSKVSV